MFFASATSYWPLLSGLRLCGFSSAAGPGSPGCSSSVSRVADASVGATFPRSEVLER